MQLNYKYNELSIDMIDSGRTYELDGDKKIITVIIPDDEEAYVDGILIQISKLLNNLQ